MKWLSQVPIRTKHLAGLVALIALLVTVIVTAYWGLVEAQKLQEELSAARTTTVNDLPNLRANLNSQRMIIGLVLMSNGRRLDWGPWEQALRESTHQSDEIIQRLLAHFRTDPVQLKTFNEFLAIRKVFLETREAQVLPLLRAGRTDEATQVYLGIQTERHGKMSALIRQLELEEVAQAETTIREVRWKGEILAASFAVLGIAAILVAMVLGRLMNRAIASYLDERKHAEEAALRAKEDWEKTFESVPDLVAILDRNYQIVRANSAMAARLGCTPEECVGLTCYHAVHGTAEPPPYCPQRKLLADGCEHTVEVHADSLGGDFLVSVSPLPGADGTAIGSVHVARDITESKRAQRAALEQFQLAETVFNHSIGSLVILDRDYNFIRVNEAYARACRRDISEFDGRNHFEMYPSDAKEIFDDVVRTKKPFITFTRAFVFPDQPERGITYWDWTLVPILDKEGEVEYLVFSLNEVTERKRAEVALRTSEERYRALFENATSGILHSTSDGRILDANPALVAMLGYESLEELQRTNLERDVYLRPEDRQRFLDQYEAAGRAGPADIEWKRKDGKIIIVRSSGRAIRNAEGRIVEFEVILDDVTEQRALERQYREAQKTEAIGQLAGGIAHDFNNALGAMLGWAELGLEATHDDCPARFHLEKIRDQAQRTAGLTQQLLAFARRQTLQPRNINLNHTVGETTGMLANVIGEHIEVKTSLAAELDSAWADPTQIEQVLMNLCLNARDAMPKGGRLTIETRNAIYDQDFCRRHTYARPGHFVELVVSDTGVGMDAATLEHIFEPFFTTKGPGKGTGMGLATVYGIVKQSGGFIRVYSEVGHGSTFYVTLPTGSGAAFAEDQESTEPASGGSETILLAEDHEGIRKLMFESLSKLGYRVVVAADGEEAVRLFEQNRGSVALLLLDAVMPRLSGPEACARIHALEPGVPVLFSTGYSNESQLLGDLVQQGAQVIGKPVSIRLLARKVREILDRAKPRSE